MTMCGSEQFALRRPQSCLDFWGYSRAGVASHSKLWTSWLCDLRRTLSRIESVRAMMKAIAKSEEITASLRDAAGRVAFDPLPDVNRVTRGQRCGLRLRATLGVVRMRTHQSLDVACDLRAVSRSILCQSKLEFSVEWVSRFAGHMTVHPHHFHAGLDILEIH